MTEADRKALNAHGLAVARELGSAGRELEQVETTLQFVGGTMAESKITVTTRVDRDELGKPVALATFWISPDRGGR